MLLPFFTFHYSLFTAFKWRGVMLSAGWRALLNQISEEQKEFVTTRINEISDLPGKDGVWFNTEVLIAVGQKWCLWKFSSVQNPFNSSTDAIDSISLWERVGVRAHDSCNPRTTAVGLHKRSVSGVAPGTTLSYPGLRTCKNPVHPEPVEGYTHAGWYPQP